MSGIFTSRVHVFSQLVCFWVGVLILGKSGFVGYVSAEWVAYQINSELPAWLVIFFNPLILAFIAICLDLVVGSDNGTASYEGTHALMHFAFCISAGLIMFCQYKIFSGI